MDRSGGGIMAAAVLLAVFAGGGIRGSQGFSANVSTDGPVNPETLTHVSETARSAEGRSSDKRDGYADQLRRVTAFIADAIPSTPATDQDRQANSTLRRPKSMRPDGRVGLMVALVPDPLKTHLSLVFDRYVDALEQAIQDGQFDFNRALLPWDDRDHPESSNFGTRVDERDYVRGEQQAPGVLIFRRHHIAGEKPPPEPMETLVVFVVGESPTAGVNRRQFITAVRLAKQLALQAEEAQPLTIIGPSFSGSLYSLATLLKSESGSFSGITIASGTVSDPDSVGSARM